MGAVIRARLVVGPVALLFACQGVISTPLSEPEADAGGVDSTRRPGQVPVGDPELCVDADLHPAAPRLRRLTAAEYNHTVRDLLGDASEPGGRIGADESVGGYEANAIAPVTESQVETYVDVAGELAAATVRDRLPEWLPCDWGESECVAPFVAFFGMRAFRRPLTSEEELAFVELYESSRGPWGADTALELVLQAMLASPDFLYHVEPDGPEGVLVSLDPYQLASALSYFLWSSMPDDELLFAAGVGELDSSDQIETQARRMLSDPKAADAIASFASQWLEVLDASELEKDEARFPEWNGEVAQAAHDEVLTFVDHVVRRGDGSLHTLLTGPFTFGTEGLADLYGAANGPDADGRIELDPSERAGFLTQSGFLASHSYATEVSWVHRGLFVREQLLCDPVGSPPANINSTDTNNPGRLTNATCAYCHVKMDMIGVGFDRYSPTGRTRTLDDEGAPVNDAGEVYGGEELGVPTYFRGPVELAHGLAASDRVHECFTRQLYRFAMRRDEASGDSCELGGLRDVFVESGYDIGELLVAIAASETFRFRRVGTAERGESGEDTP